MFPSNLQKSIRELDRQISLLETECEHMESEKNEFSPPLKKDSKLIIKESSNKPFITGPCNSSSSYINKTPPFSHTVPKISASCSPITKTPGENFEDDKTFKKIKPGSKTKSSLNFHETYKKFTEYKANHPSGWEIQTEVPAENKELASRKKFQICDSNSHNRVNRSINSIKEVSETSDDNKGVCPLSRNKQDSDLALKEKTRSHADSKIFLEGWKERKDESTDDCSNQPKLCLNKPSSEGGSRKPSTLSDRQSVGNGSLECESSLITRNKIFTKRRPRSVRTKKNNISEAATGVNISKSLIEKEIQCMLFGEEGEKTEFLDDINNSIKTLQLLIGELKEKSSEDRKKDVLNDMQNTLEKISSIKSINAINNPLLSCSKGKNVKSLESNNDVVDLKKILLGVKLYCQELSDEKQTMTLKLAAKNRTIEGLKNNEKEYLSLISSLKFNLEKLKEEAEEGSRAIKELKILKKKLMEEAKVIEALKKSHAKMQALVEKYVLENDKMRAQVKMSKLESQKFTVLLAGKEAEIYKYKKEIESFQKQITEQLSLLRSKASENQIAQTIAVIKKQSIFHAEVDSCPSETTIDKEFNANYYDSKSVESVSTTRAEDKYKRKNPFKANRGQLEKDSKSGKQTEQTKDLGDEKDAGFTSCRSDDSEESVKERKCHTCRTKKTEPETFWPVTQNSSNSTQCSTVTNTSENEKES